MVLCLCGYFLSVLSRPVGVSAQLEPTRPSFTEFLAGVKNEAVARGISEQVVDEALADVEEPMPVVIERDRAQAELVQSFERYVSHHVSAKTVRTGREMLARHAVVLAQVSKAYGVPPGIILAVWAIESNYGRFSGVRPTIAALATLAWDPRRSTFFRGELFDALEILNRGDIDLEHLKGSWAGAMGQVQFMPSSYLDYAEDFDGDGRRDIWSSPADVFASIANYLLGHGWRAGESWGREVRVPGEAEKKVRSDVERRNGSCQATRDMTVALPLARWTALGVRLTDGKPLPKADLQASLVSGAKRHFLVYGNYDALLDYNCAHSYALSVGLLADRIGGGLPSANRSPSHATRRRSR